MSRTTQVIGGLLRAGVGAIGSLLVWTLWLGLGLLLVAQLYILTASELAIPDFLLRQAEAKLAESGLRATFGRTSFDPAGRVLVHDVRFFLPGYAEPIARARAIFLQVNPLALTIGRFEPSEVRVMNAVATIPAALSQSGRPEEILRGLEATIAPATRLLILQQLSANIAGIAVSARGTVPLQPRAATMETTAIAEFFAHRFAPLCRQASALAVQLAHVESPSLYLDLAPSASGALSIQVRALASAVQLPAPFAGTATNVRASTRLLLFGDRPPSHVAISADDVQLEVPARIRRLHAAVSGQIRPGSLHFDLREVLATADSVEAEGTALRTLSVAVYPRPLPRLQADIVTAFLDEPLGLSAESNLDDKTARVRFAGSLSPTLLDLISARVGVNVRKYYDFDALTVDTAEARFAPGWKFEKLTARVQIPRMNSYGVIMEDGRTTVELDPRRFYSPDAYARVGENFARGTYEHDLQTQNYRFLLTGRLRPLALSPWFRDWWPNFFQQIEFVDAPPAASVDVGGNWRDGQQSRVFVFTDAARTVVRGVPFDRVRTRLFLRPAFFDGLELYAWRGSTDAHGRFTLVSHPRSHEWHTLDLALTSTVDLKVAEELLGPPGKKALAPFRLAAPPLLNLRATFAGPAAAPGAKDRLRIDARTQGAFHFYDFPLEDTSFIATLDGDEIVLDNVAATFAGGTVSGHARVWGTGQERRVGFDLALQDATLGRVAARLQEYFAAQKGVPPPPPGKFVKEKAAVRLDIAASAEGPYSDPLGFRGDGNASLRGAEIGEVPLLGTLSELLKFTALRFTEARANFKIEGPKLMFRKVELRGANSAVDAHGEYAFDKRLLDFNAKVFPFQESESIIKSVVGAVLTPLSNALEVKLTGSLEKPEWAFVMGPTNILRTLGEGGGEAQAPAPGHPPAPTPPAPKPSSGGR